MYNLKLKLLLLQLIIGLSLGQSLFRRVGFGDDPPHGATYPYTSQVRVKVYFHNDKDAEKSLVSGCTGTVVAPRVVLTAGHCLNDKPPFKVQSVAIRYGGFIRSTNQTKIKTSGWLKHPEYKKQVDLGLIFLSEPVNISCNEMIFPEKWDLSSKVLDNHRHTYMCGWGIDQADQKDGKIKSNTVAPVIES